MKDEEKEILKVREFLLELLKSFFMLEPDEEVVEKWKKVLGALRGASGVESFDEAVEALYQHLASCDLSELKEEHYRYFVDPFSNKQLILNASFYVDGKNYGPTLAKLRDFLQKVGLEKKREFKEPEDSLICLLDFMIWLIYTQDEGGRKRVEEFLREFLRPCVKGVAEALERRGEDGFYRKCIRLVEAYLNLEEMFLREG